MPGWSDEQINRVRALWEKGLSAAEIAFRMPGRTRNSICGLIHREGFNGMQPPKPPPMTKPRIMRPATTASESTRHRGPVLQKILHHQAAHAARSLPMEPPPQPRGDRPGLMELKPDECKWPFGDPRHKAFHFCGARRAGDGPYCSVHAAAARATPGTGIKFDDEENDLIRALWQRGRGIGDLVERLGRPQASIIRQAIVQLKLPKAA